MKSVTQTKASVLRDLRSLADPKVRAKMSYFGISVKKALGGAVVRNRIRRRIKEMLRLHRLEIPAGWDIVIHPRPSVARADFSRLTTELTALLRSALK